MVRAKPNRILLLAAALALAAGGLGCHRHKHARLDASASQEPDKVLYQRALEDIHSRRWDVARLTLQTLINTYPDSDYLAASKLAIADSYFEEGSTSALTHAEVEYKDYMTFFPSDPKAAYAQYRAAMCHWQQLEKSDRDRTHAQRAQEEFQQLLKAFPDSEYAADGERKLLQVQELLADSEFRVARFYFIRESWRAAASRLSDLVERYPNYSSRDEALWMLGQASQKKIPYYWEPGPDLAPAAFARLIREHPMSDHLADTKAELARLGKPVPEPDPALLARAQTVKPVGEEPAQQHQGLLGRMFGILNSRPDLSNAAARLGPPPLEPPRDLPKLPPPRIPTTRRESTVTAQAQPGGDGVPSGTVVQTAPGEKPAGETASPPAAGPPNQGASNNEKKEEPPPRKKPFWRKLVPFWK